MRDLNVICLTIDTEWAHPEVLNDTVQLLDDAGVRATFFCTHAGICVPGHERALHPNFRWDGDTARAIANDFKVSQSSFFRAVVQHTKEFCPEAIGVRAHSLFYDSQLLPIYKSAGICYDSTYFLPLNAGIGPVWKEYDILELPIYWMDHWHLLANPFPFAVSAMQLDLPGLKVLDFHPNLVFLNAHTEQEYLESKPFYHDPNWLADHRWTGHGVRTLLLELLEWIGRSNIAVITLQEVDQYVRKQVR